MRDYNDFLMEAYESRERLVGDKFRPKYHFLPPEGRWNDVNGAIFWQGRYHIGYLQKIVNGPETNGQLSHLGSMLAGPETLIDDKGRRIFWGWIKEARDWEKPGWSSIMTLPWHFTPAADNSLKINPAEELKSLRYDEKKVDDIALAAGGEVVIDELCSDCMETKITIVPENTAEFGIKLLCSPDGEEQTIITYNTVKQVFIIDFDKASNDKTLAYPRRIDAKTSRLNQITPYPLAHGGELELDVFVDKSVIEIFVNSEICLVQRVYPRRAESNQFRLFTRDGAVTVKNIVRWKMDTTNPW